MIVSSLKSGVHNILNFKGRAGRQEFLPYFLCVSVVILLIYFLIFFKFDYWGVDSIIKSWFYFILFYLFIGGGILSLASIIVRRLHDLGRTAFFLILPIICFICLDLIPQTLAQTNCFWAWIVAILLIVGTYSCCLLFIFMFLPSQLGRNHYGLSPKPKFYY